MLHNVILLFHFSPCVRIAAPYQPVLSDFQFVQHTNNVFMKLTPQWLAYRLYNTYNIYTTHIMKWKYIIITCLY